MDFSVHQEALFNLKQARNKLEFEGISFGDKPVWTALQICCPPVRVQTKEGGTWSTANSCDFSVRSAVHTFTDRHKICNYALFQKMICIYYMLNIIRTCWTMEELRRISASVRFFFWDLPGSSPPVARVAQGTPSMGVIGTFHPPVLAKPSQQAQPA